MSKAIPQEWSIQPLGKLADVRSSNVDKKVDDSEESVRLCNYTDVYYRKRITSEIDFMHATAKPREIERFSLEKGDVIITKDSETPDDIAVPSFVSDELKGVLCGYHLTLLRPYPSYAYGEYLSYLFQLASVRHYFYLLANGTTRFGLTADAISNAPLMIAPLPEQQKIATILSSVDDVIEKTRAQIDKLKDLKTGMMQELLTKGVGVDGVPHTEFKDSPVGRIPAGWDVQPLNKLVTSEKNITYGIVQAGPHFEGGVPYIRVSDMTSRVLVRDGMLLTSPEIAEKYHRSAVSFGDIVYALRGVIGHVQLVPTELEGANLTQGTARISPNSKIDGRYLLWAMRSPSVKEQNELEAKGSTFREITLASLRKILIALPTLEEQKKLASILDSIELRMFAVEDKLAELTSIKKALMQDLLTGKVRVNVTDEETAAVNA